MKEMLNKLQTVNRTATFLAGGSFIIGTLILLLYLITREEGFAFLGVGFLFLAVPFNGIMLLSVIVHLILDKISLKEALWSSYVLLLNVPIAYSYFYLVIEIL